MDRLSLMLHGPLHTGCHSTACTGLQRVQGHLLLLLLLAYSIVLVVWSQTH
jgi:hypothetical protein